MARYFFDFGLNGFWMSASEGSFYDPPLAIRQAVAVTLPAMAVTASTRPPSATSKAAWSMPRPCRLPILGPSPAIEEARYGLAVETGKPKVRPFCNLLRPSIPDSARLSPATRML